MVSAIQFWCVRVGHTMLSDHPVRAEVSLPSVAFMQAVETLHSEQKERAIETVNTGILLRAIETPGAQTVGASREHIVIRTPRASQTTTETRQWCASHQVSEPRHPACEPIKRVKPMTYPRAVQAV